MKKLFYLLLLTSCGYNPIDFTKPVVITDIESDGEHCYYYTRDIKVKKPSNYGYFYYTCGVFTVGDTIKLKL